MHTDRRSGDVCILLCLHSLDKHFIKAMNWGEGATGKSLSGLGVSLDDINTALKYYNIITLQHFFHLFIHTAALTSCSRLLVSFIRNSEWGTFEQTQMLKLCQFLDVPVAGPVD